MEKLCEKIYYSLIEFDPAVQATMVICGSLLVGFFIYQFFKTIRLLYGA